MVNYPIKVLLVEDSPIALEILGRLLSSSSEVKVVGKAHNGKEALELIPKTQPAVICTDLHMKEMDGLAFTQHIMATDPRPILVISNSVQKENTQTIFQLLQAGALDVFPKPTTGLASDYEQVKRDLIGKIKLLAGVTVFTKRQPTLNNINNSATSVLHSSTALAAMNVTSSIRIVTIGASTGGPQALHKILAQLPANFPLPVICTQHISEGFLQGLIDWLGSECKLKVKIAQSGESPHPGTIYFAPERRHLELDSMGRFNCSLSSPVDGHCPSITVVFKSVAKFYGRGTAGVLLTGMGKDGAAGMQAIDSCGGMTIAQDEKSSVIFGMPKEAIALGAVGHILPIHEIAPFLLNKIFRG